MKAMAVADIAFNYHLDGLLTPNVADQIALDETYFQRLLDDFQRANSPIQNSGIKPSTIQYFKDNFSDYAAGQYRANNGDSLEHSLNVKA